MGISHDTTMATTRCRRYDRATGGTKSPTNGRFGGCPGSEKGAAYRRTSSTSVLNSSMSSKLRYTLAKRM